MPSPLGVQVVAALAAARLSQRKFCALVGFNQGSLQAVLSGKRKPPRDGAVTWADALDLRGRERETFLEAYWLCHSPPEIASLIARLRAELARRR